MGFVVFVRLVYHRGGGGVGSGIAGLSLESFQILVSKLWDNEGKYKKYSCVFRPLFSSKAVLSRSTPEPSRVCVLERVVADQGITGAVI